MNKIVNTVDLLKSCGTWHTLLKSTYFKPNSILACNLAKVLWVVKFRYLTNFMFPNLPRMQVNQGLEIKQSFPFVFLCRGKHHPAQNATTSISAAVT